MGFTRSRCPLVAQLVVVVLTLVGRLAAQSPEQRTTLRRFQDSLKTVQDSKALTVLEQSFIAQARTRRNDPMLHLRMGLLALRMEELGNKKHLDYAVSEFEWAVEQKPDWPWPWYGLALAERIAPDRSAGMAGGLFTMLHLDRDSKSGNAFSKSFKADSNFAEGLLGLANVVLDQRNSPPLTGTLNSVRRMTATQADPQLFLALGRLERLGGSPDSALLAFKRAQETGDSSAMVWLEIARTIPLVAHSAVEFAHLPDGDTAYYKGAKSDDPEVVAMYRSDLSPIVQDTALKGFDAARGQTRVSWLRKFWSDRDQLDMLPEGSRLEEHFRRWAYVRQNYRLPRENRMYVAGQETFKSGSSDIDDRGIVYLRHGEPTHKYVFGPGGRAGSVPTASCAPATALPTPARYDGPANGQPVPIKQIGPKNLMVFRTANETNYGNETWIYEKPDADMMLHFAANHNPLDYRLMSTVFGLAAGAENPGEFQTNPGLRRLCRFGGQGIPFDWSAVSEEKIRGKNANMMATTTDSWTRTYPQPLIGKANWFAVGNYGGMPLVHLVYSVDARVVSAQSGASSPVTLRAVFLDATGNIVKTADTIVMVRHPASSATKYMALRWPVWVPVSTQRVRLNAEVTPDIGAIYKTDTLRLPRVDGTALSLSDILIGRSPNSLPWHPTPLDVAWLDPLQVAYSQADTLQIYAEAYGIKPLDKYSVSLEFMHVQGIVGKALGKRTPAIHLVEPNSFGEDVAHIRRGVSLATLAPGNYVLVLTVDGKNGKVTKERTLTIVPRVIR